MCMHMHDGSADMCDGKLTVGIVRWRKEREREGRMEGKDVTGGKREREKAKRGVA